MTIPEAGRADRRTRLLSAAATVFAREGLDAPVPAIAAEAGVGIGTLYREFASKEALVAALALERIDWFDEQAHIALAADDAGEALFDLLRRGAERQAGDRVVAAALAATSQDPAVQAAIRRVNGALGRLVLAAQREGAVAPGVTPADVPVVFAAVRGVIAEGRDWRRALELLLAGLRA